MTEQEGTALRIALRNIIDALPPGFAVVVALSVLAIGVTLVKESIERPREDTIQTRIETLSNSLEKAASTIAEIEQEIDKRMGLVSELEQRAQLAEQLQAEQAAS